MPIAFSPGHPEKSNYIMKTMIEAARFAFHSKLNGVHQRYTQCSERARLYMPITNG
jgi:hypothetical protein